MVDRLALVERVGQPALDVHPPDEPPLLGQAVERDRRAPADAPAGAAALAAAGVAVLLPLEEVERHRHSSAAPAVLADRLDDAGVGEGRRVAERRGPRRCRAAGGA